MPSPVILSLMAGVSPTTSHLALVVVSFHPLKSATVEFINPRSCHVTPLFCAWSPALGKSPRRSAQHPPPAAKIRGGQPAQPVTGRGPVSGGGGLGGACFARRGPLGRPAAPTGRLEGGGRLAGGRGGRGDTAVLQRPGQPFGGNGRARSQPRPLREFALSQVGENGLTSQARGGGG